MRTEDRKIAKAWKEAHAQSSMRAIDRSEKALTQSMGFKFIESMSVPKGQVIVSHGDGRFSVVNMS